MWRHRSFVFDSSRLVRSAVFKLHEMVERSEKLNQRVESMCLAVNRCNAHVSELSVKIKEMGQPYPAASKACVKECRDSVDNMLCLKSEVVQWMEHAERLMVELYYNKNVLRDGAADMSDNLNDFEVAYMPTRANLDVARYWCDRLC